MGFFDKLREAAAGAMLTGTNNSITRHRDTLVIVKRPSRPDDATSEAVRTFWTYEVQNGNFGFFSQTYCPDPDMVVEAPGNDPNAGPQLITDAGLKNRIIDNMLAELKDISQSAARSEGLEPTFGVDGTDFEVSYKPRKQSR